MKRTVTGLLLAMAVAGTAQSETIERLKFGDMDEWVTRIVKESSILGGHTKNVYEIGPTSTDATGKPYYSRGGSPWATSNVLAKVVGITKTSNAVFPDKREGHGQCAKLTTMLEHCKAIGLINIDVLVAGSIFLGRMIEPIKSTKNPYSNMEMGISFNRRPKALQFDYKIEVPKRATACIPVVSERKRRFRARTRRRCSSFCSGGGRTVTATCMPSVSALAVSFIRRHRRGGWKATAFLCCTEI